MRLVVNGQLRESAAGSLAELLAELQLDVEHVAVELNQAIVARGRFAATRLQENDRLEVIRFVGGG
jgi:thiamine biosynthesis protein ThiS